MCVNDTNSAKLTWQTDLFVCHRKWETLMCQTAVCDATEHVLLVMV